ncbi:(2Fe-2S)-binding protein [Labrys monachus]|uniref:Nicotinate dehydrogenase subunit A n=1 Tax=Labrys monachus TaxID=217067 RepID=A0ABU0FDV0_9HYPH|nr:(2Fe-2S)-binding protein [Labrys monachus]MDQ0392770.1 nicotinate dehydrogenase subunit A [Labrys monachus]
MKPPRPHRLRVNGSERVVTAESDTPLLYLLRNDLALNGPKYGCGLGECGACTVIVDGLAARSCVLPVAMAEGREILTLEGLGAPGRLDPVQQAFIDAEAAQCGYCLNGMIMTVKALLDRDPEVGETQIRNELRFNLCRCGTHVEILQAAMLAAQRIRQARSAGA